MSAHNTADDADTINIPDLKITFDEGLGQIVLEQGMGTEWESRVNIHPIQLRLMAERAGLVPTSDPESARTIARLTRQLCKLRNELAHKSSFMIKNRSNYQDDMEYEIGQIELIYELALEYCTDLPGAPPVPEWANCFNEDAEKPTQNPPQTQQKPTANPVAGPGKPNTNPMETHAKTNGKKHDATQCNAGERSQTQENASAPLFGEG